MSRYEGYDTAINLAVEKLRKTDLNTRCSSLGLPAPQNHILPLRAFGTHMILHLDDFSITIADTGKPAKVSDVILIFHYLLCNGAPALTGTGTVDDLISFRQMDSGMFYWEAFLSRSVRPLVDRVANNLELLEKNLDRFDWERVPMGDVGARIHAIGNVFVTLVYHQGDDEFPPAAELLFDSNIKRIYPTEDVAVLAGRICLGLL